MIHVHVEVERSIKSAMGNNKELRPRGAVGVYILEGDKILLLLRKSSHGNGTWCPPGGHIEYGESIFTAAQREAKEEVGADIGDFEILGVTSDVYNDEKKHYLTVHVKVTNYSNNVSLLEPDKFHEMRWFSLNNLPENMFLVNKNLFVQNPLCLCGSGNRHNECHGKQE